MSEFKSNIQSVISRLRAGKSKGLDAAADALIGRMQQTLSVAYPPASSGGQAPRMRSGRLRMAIAKSGVEGDEIKVGISTDIGGIKRLPPAIYGKFLENGTSKMSPRPFFKPMLRDGAAKNSILSAFEKKIKEAIQ
jgi:HK97 gp10 family phage protein